MQTGGCCAKQKFSIDGGSITARGLADELRRGTTYSYVTKVPARRVPPYYNEDFYDAGKIVMNGTATAAFSMVGNPDEGQVLMHIDLDVRHLGNFDYEVEPGNLWGLEYAARCAP
jgi:hypothetical protein